MYPQSITKFCVVIHFDFFDNKKIIIFATSSASPQPNGYFEFSVLILWAVNGVFTSDGDTQLTLTFELANSRAIHLQEAAIAALEPE